MKLGGRNMYSKNEGGESVAYFVINFLAATLSDPNLLNLY